MPIPDLGKPYVVRHWQVTAVVECRHCDAHATVFLTNTVVGRCPSCGAPFALGGLEWDSEARPLPKIIIGTAPPLTASVPVGRA
jgi:hypothetical protein